MKQKIRLGDCYALTKHKHNQLNIRNFSLLAVLTIMCLYAVKQVSAQEAEPAATAVADTTISIRDTLTIEEVQVNTGYQRIPKERATGSFVLIDNALLNRKISTNIIDRLDGVTSGLIFNKNQAVGGSKSDISIRGRSTIHGNPNPLIVLNDFPYEGDIGSINPGDIENITVLKDAAAASIWGTRAGNGVIVITTKTGRVDDKLSIGFNSNVTLTEKPRLFSRKQLTSREFIEVEQFLFEKGRYNSTIRNGYGALSPAIEILLAESQRTISSDERRISLDSLAGIDIRNQQLEHQYRIGVNQQYQMNFQGGSPNYSFYASIGYDNNKSDDYTAYRRTTFSIGQTIRLLKGRLLLKSNTFSVSSRSQSANTSYSPRYPYESIATDSGTPLAVTDGILRLSYAEHHGDLLGLDWLYRPLAEMALNNASDVWGIRNGTTLTYNIIESLKLSGAYTYHLDAKWHNKLAPLSSYETRAQINKQSQVNPATNEVVRPLPLGDILYANKNKRIAHFGRVQLSFSRLINVDHAVDAILGVELRSANAETSGNIFYGYNPETGINQNQSIDYSKNYPNYYGSGTSIIRTGDNIRGSTDRNRSFYGNVAYHLKSKYTLSASIRKDESNIFGVKANQRGVPLWSAGMAWLLSAEPFYTLHFLDRLKIRATYGYNGNIDNSISALLTARYLGISSYGTPYSVIVNPPNPSLKWERVANTNFGLDFSMWSNRITGVIEYYRKNGKDLIGISSIAPQTGITTFTGNTASQLTEGVDISLTLNNVELGQLKWSATILSNFVRNKITEYDRAPGTNYNLVNESYQHPVIGHPYNAVFSYRWAGLDSEGNPQAYYEDVPSSDYTSLANSTNRDDLVYHGASTPNFFGSIINNLQWRGLSLSFIVTYKAGYYFRRNSLDNRALFNSGTYQMADYSKRWKQPGDELKTQVPSLVYPAPSSRTNAYTFSEVLVEKGSHLRLKEIQINYLMDRFFSSNGKNPLPLHIFLNIADMGVLWEANRYNIDPDNRLTALSRSVTFGFKSNF